MFERQTWMLDDAIRPSKDRGGVEKNSLEIDFLKVRSVISASNSF